MTESKNGSLTILGIEPRNIIDKILDAEGDVVAEGNLQTLRSSIQSITEPYYEALQMIALGDSTGYPDKRNIFRCLIRKYQLKWSTNAFGRYSQMALGYNKDNRLDRFSLKVKQPDSWDNAFTMQLDFKEDPDLLTPGISSLKIKWFERKPKLLLSLATEDNGLAWFIRNFCYQGQPSGAAVRDLTSSLSIDLGGNPRLFFYHPGDSRDADVVWYESPELCYGYKYSSRDDAFLRQSTRSMIKACKFFEVSQATRLENDEFRAIINSSLRLIPQRQE